VTFATRARRLVTGDRRLVLFQIVGQLALVGVTPILTRIVSVSDMGVYQLAISLALILQPLATFRTEYEIPVSPNRLTLSRSVQTAWTAIPAVSALLFLGLVLTHLHDLSMGAVLGASAVLVLVAYSMTAVNNAELIRYAQTSRLAWRNLLTGLIGAALQVLLALWWHDAIALAVGLFLGRAIAQFGVRVPRGAELSEHRHEPVKHSAGRIARTILAGMVGNASSQAVVLFAGAEYGTRSAGELGLSQRIVGAPTSLAGQGLSQMVMGVASNVIRNDERTLARQLRPVVLKLLALSAALTIVVAACAPWLTPIVLGAGWERAGVLIAILSLPLSFQLALVPLSGVFMLVHKEQSLLILQISRLAAIVAALLVGQFVQWPFVDAMILVSTVWSASYAAFFVAVVAAMRNYDRNGLAAPSRSA
jgi:O-antigen/teichoic acid export membrane protein